MIRRIVLFLRDAIAAWQDDRASQMAASLAYYAVFSLAPVLLILIAIGGMLLNRETVQREVLAQVMVFAGPEAMNFLREVLEARSLVASSFWGTVAGVVILLIASTGLIGAMRTSLNRVWNITIQPGFDILLLIRRRTESFALILLIGALLLCTVIASTVLSASVAIVSPIIAVPDIVVSLLNSVLLLALTTALFSLLFQYLPDAHVPWRALLPGAFFTAVLFLIGKLAFSFYMVSTNIVSAYGVAGSLIVLLLWVYYSAQIFLFGAEATKVYAGRIGAAILPQPYASFGEKSKEEGRDGPSLAARVRIIWKTVRFEIRMARRLQRWKKKLWK